MRTDPGPALVESAVLVPVYRGTGGEVRLILIRRTHRGPHGGQIAFPGGMREDSDRDLQETALRETAEEIGLDPGNVRILEELPEVVTVTTGFRIRPFLARIEPPQRWRPQEEEVKEILDLAVSDLDGTEVAASEPCYPAGAGRIWGATFRILRPLVPRLLDGDWAL